jgi:hypothetical protein
MRDRQISAELQLTKVASTNVGNERGMTSRFDVYEILSILTRERSETGGICCLPAHRRSQQIPHRLSAGSE